MKRDGNASDHLRKQAADNPQDELATGLSGQPESIQPEALLTQVLDRTNLQRALKQVRRNKGAPGIDGMTVDELPKYLRDHWLEIGAQLEAGTSGGVGGGSREAFSYPDWAFSIGTGFAS